jgi:hypothetical protein
MGKRGSFIAESTPRVRAQQCGQSAGVEVQPRPVSQSDGPGHVAPPPQLSMPVHSTSHWQAAPQLIAPFMHECLPLQLTSHAPLPQVAVPTQLDGPPHVIEHVVAPLQSTPPAHAFWPPHVTVHGRPGGHTTALAHEPS